MRTIMSNPSVRCVLLADRNQDLAEGMRGLLETTFGVVVMVADQASLIESAGRLRPTVAVVDLALAGGNYLGMLKELRERSPKLRLLVISVHDEPSVRKAVMESGADAFVLKREIATELLPAIDAIMAKSKDTAAGTKSGA
jgi:two-component system secretion response regulator SsrB